MFLAPASNPLLIASRTISRGSVKSLQISRNSACGITSGV